MNVSSLLLRRAPRETTGNDKAPHISLEDIRVASPCPADWDNMAGNDRARHCQECKLNVYNLSDMTRVEAEQLIISREGRLCVRFFRRGDGTILTRDCPRGLRALTDRVSRVAGAVLSAMMSVGVAFAQTPPKPSPQAQSNQTAQKATQLALTVVDQQGAVISGAKIQLADKSGKIQFTGVTRFDGVAFVSGVSPGPLVLKIEGPGFKTYKEKITIARDQAETLRIALKTDEKSVTVTVGELMDDISPLMDRDSATVKTSFSGDLLQHMPLR